MTRPLPLVAAFAIAVAACAGSKKPSPANMPAPEPVRPLATFAGTRIMALPAQKLAGGDATGWVAKMPSPRAWLASVDSALEASLRERRVASVWTFPTELVRSARRNPMYATDPSEIRAAEAVRLLERRPDSRLAEPVASQLRALAGIHDARYAFVPVEIRFEQVTRDGKPAGRAILHAAVVDIRVASLSWSGDVASEVFADLSPALVASLASRLADLIVAR